MGEPGEGSIACGELKLVYNIETEIICRAIKTKVVAGGLQRASTSRQCLCVWSMLINRDLANYAKGGVRAKPRGWVGVSFMLQTDI